MSGKQKIEWAGELLKKEELAPDNEDSSESLSGDGRNSRHQVFAIQIVDDDKKLYVFPYSSIDIGEGTFNGTEFTFSCETTNAIYLITLKGPQVQNVVDRLSAGKRESIRPNGATLTSVRVQRVEAEAGSA